MKTSPSGQKSFKAVERVVAESGVSVSKEVCLRLSQYFDELEAWNRRMDLTGLKDVDSMVVQHLGDTLTLYPLLGDSPLRLLDIGTGAGVPGLLLKILFPTIEATLVDSRRKRISFLRYCIARLGLQGVEALHLTLRPNVSCPPLMPASYDVVTSRAVAGLKEMAHLTRPYLAPGGRLILMKGPKGLMELEEYANILEKEGWRFDYMERRLPITNARRIIVVGVVESP